MQAIYHQILCLGVVELDEEEDGDVGDGWQVLFRLVLHFMVEQQRCMHHIPPTRHSAGAVADHLNVLRILIFRDRP